MSKAASTASMPRVWNGRRRGLLVSLALLGVLQAVLAVMMALFVDSILSPEQDSDSWDVLALVASVLGVGLARWLERVVAEDVGQDYVFEQRGRLVTAAIGDGTYNSSLGVTVTRASNDLTSLRNWIALGIVPLVTGIPLIGVILIALLMMNLSIAGAVMVPLLVIVAIMPMLSSVTLSRARQLRKVRGRMSARIADTVMAGESVRASGAVHREIRAVDRDSTKVVRAAVDRAWITGLTRALTATAASSCTVAVVLLTINGGISATEVASTMTLLGVLTTPVTDLGRVVEYRQNYRAAKRILAPLLQQADDIREEERARTKEWKDNHGGSLEIDSSAPQGVRISGLIANDQRIPDMVARPGTCVRMVSDDPNHARVIISVLTSLFEEEILEINGMDFGAAPGRVRRKLMGFASDSVRLERGSIRRLVSYRCPEATDEDLQRVLEKAGLWEAINADSRGLNRKIKNGGDALASDTVMLLKLCRAFLDGPPLVILENVDAGLSAEDNARLKELNRTFEGVILFSSNNPDLLFDDYEEWVIDGEEIDPQESGQQELRDDDEDGE